MIRDTAFKTNDFCVKDFSNSGVTNTNINKATCRVPQAVRVKARCAGNGYSLAKHRNAEPGRLWDSLRASRWMIILSVASACHSSRYARANAPCELTAQRLAAYGFIYVSVRITCNLCLELAYFSLQLHRTRFIQHFPKDRLAA
jgi:hypothetical protein